MKAGSAAAVSLLDSGWGYGHEVKPGVERWPIKRGVPHGAGLNGRKL